MAGRCRSLLGCSGHGAPVLAWGGGLRQEEVSEVDLSTGLVCQCGVEGAGPVDILFSAGRQVLCCVGGGGPGGEAGGGEGAWDSVGLERRLWAWTWRRRMQDRRC